MISSTRQGTRDPGVSSKGEQEEQKIVVYLSVIVLQVQVPLR